MSNFELNPDVVSKLSSSAVLVNLSLSVWSGRKLDKRVSQEVDAAKSTKTRAGNYHKNLLAGTDKLDAINKVAGAVRTWHYTVTQPWSDNGARILNAEQMFDYKARLVEFEREFVSKVHEFLNEYDNLVSAAAFSLGDLFDRDEYPTREEIERKFGFGYTIEPLPQSGDFRVEIGDEGLRELQAQYEQAITNRVEQAMRDSWDRLHDVLSKMSERLESTEDGKRKIFRDSLVENAHELCNLLKHFNVNQDVRLESMRMELSNLLSGVDAETLRESDELRDNTKRKVDALLGKF
jgi:hypothetical protein